MMVGQAPFSFFSILDVYHALFLFDSAIGQL